MGREQAGRRPVVVISDARLSGLGLAIIVPLTTTDRGWDIHVPVRVNRQRSIAMCEQIRSVSLDRLTGHLGVISYQELMDIRATTRSLIGF